MRIIGLMCHSDTDTVIGILTQMERENKMKGILQELYEIWSGK